MALADTDDLSRFRRQLLIASGLSFAVWQLVQLDMINLWLPSKGPMIILGTIGLVIWVATLVGLLTRFAGSRLGPAARAALTDERTDAIRHKAMLAGYAAMLVMIVILTLANYLGTVSTKDALILLLVTGVSGALLSFGWLDRDVE